MRGRALRQHEILTREASYGIIVFLRLAWPFAHDSWSAILICKGLIKRLSLKGQRAIIRWLEVRIVFGILAKNSHVLIDMLRPTNLAVPKKFPISIYMSSVGK